MSVSSFLPFPKFHLSLRPTYTQVACIEGIIRLNLIGQSRPNFSPQLVLNFLPIWQLLNDTGAND